MKNMLITGGAGFIGSNFIRYLLSESDYPGRIINVDKLTYAGNLENLVEIKQTHPNRYYFLKVDICDADAVAKVFDEFEIDAVCHFAAESHVDRSIATPDAFIRSNIVGTFNLLEAVRARFEKRIRFHHISTDEVYGSLGPDGLFKEETPYDPSSPYSASKAASDHLVRAYFKTYGLAVTLSNCSNNYGPYQFPEKLIPLIILNGLEGKLLPVYGDGGNVRDWLHVKDHCRAVWEIMRKGRLGETYHVGGHNEMRNIDVVRMICTLLDDIEPLPGERPHSDLIRFVKDRPGHDRRYAMDFSKLRNELGWEPAESFETGIRKTITWYRQNSGWVKRVKSGAYRDWMREHYRLD